MKKTAVILSVLGLVLGGVFTFSKSVSAYRGDPSVEGPNHSEERHQAMTQVFEANDYNAWKEQMQGRGRVTQVINEENFARFAEAHQLALEGKTDEANQIRQELGLGLRNSSGQSGQKGNDGGRWSK